MQEVDINTLVNKNNYLNENIPNDIIIVGKIKELYINNKYEILNLFKIECDKIEYYNQENEDIKNHILPNSLKILNCSNNKLTKLPNLPNSLLELNYNNNKINIILTLPNFFKKLDCSNNELLLLPDLPSSLLELSFCNNKLILLPDTSFIKNEINFIFKQDVPMNNIPYYFKLKLCPYEPSKFYIKDYPYNPITNQKELDKYMNYQSNKKNKWNNANAVNTVNINIFNTD